MPHKPRRAFKSFYSAVITALYSPLTIARSLSRSRSLTKDVAFSTKEIASQQKRIEDTKADSEKDEHDVKKQGEVLKEYEDGQKDELERLLKAWEDLNAYIAEIEEDQPEEVKQNMKATEEWTKAGEAASKAEEVLTAHGKIDD